MTVETTRAQLADITNRMEALTTDGIVPADREAEYDDLKGQADQLAAQVERAVSLEKLERRLAQGDVYIEPGDGSVEGYHVPPGVDARTYRPPVSGLRDRIGNPFDGSRFEPANETRRRAEAAIEAGITDGRSAESAVHVLRSVEEPGVADHMILTSDPSYRSAFQKFLRDPEHGHRSFTDAEVKAWGRVADYSKRALSLSGAVLPSPLDPSIVLTNAGTIDPIRSIARVDQTTANEKRYIPSTGVTASYTAEATEVTDDTPTLSEVTVSVEKAQAWVQGSIEAVMDQPDFSQEVAKLFGDAKARLEGDKFINGSGTNAPIGIWTALDGTASELSPATAETFVAGDVYSTIEDLSPRWRANATWMAELSTWNQVDQYETGNGAKLFPQVGSSSPVLLRRRVVENSNVAAYSDINVAATADNPILYVGDFKQFIVLDRIGLTVEYVPTVFSTSNGRPTGERGWYMWWRSGSDVLVNDAFRVLNIATTA